jgi:3-isopropylmalate dehydrogenase
MLLSTAMMLRYSLNLDDEAQAIERAIDAVLDDGARTADIAAPDDAIISTEEMTDRILQHL